MFVIVNIPSYIPESVIELLNSPERPQVKGWEFTVQSLGKRPTGDTEGEEQELHIRADNANGFYAAGVAVSAMIQAFDAKIKRQAISEGLLVLPGVWYPANTPVPDEYKNGNAVFVLETKYAYNTATIQNDNFWHIRYFKLSGNGTSAIKPMNTRSKLLLRWMLLPGQEPSC